MNHNYNNKSGYKMLHKIELILVILIIEIYFIRSLLKLKIIVFYSWIIVLYISNQSRIVYYNEEIWNNIEVTDDVLFGWYKN